MPSKPITMEKHTLQEMMFLQIEQTEEGTKDYEMLCGILLRMMGYIDPDGKVAPHIARSPMWKLTGDNVLMPSVISDLATTLIGNDLSEQHIREVLATLDEDPNQAANVRAWLQQLGKAGRQGHTHKASTKQ